MYALLKAKNCLFLYFSSMDFTVTYSIAKRLVLKVNLIILYNMLTETFRFVIYSSIARFANHVL